MLVGIYCCNFVTVHVAKSWAFMKPYERVMSEVDKYSNFGKSNKYEYIGHFQPQPQRSYSTSVSL